MQPEDHPERSEDRDAHPADDGVEVVATPETLSETFSETTPPLTSPPHSRHLVPVADSPDHGYPNPANAPWEDIRRMYVQGIAVGPSLPDRQAVLDAVGEGDLLTRSRRGGGHNKVTKIGKISIVFPTREGIAAFFNVPVYQVRKRSNDEDWWTLQRIYRAQLHQQVSVRKNRERLVNVDKIDARGLRVAKIGLKMVEERLEMMTQTVEVMDGEVNPVSDYKELESLARAATVWHALGRRSLGFPTDKVGMVSDAGADLNLTEFGMYDDGTATPGDFSYPVLATPDGMAETQQSVTAELAKDDAERLAGFLQVLGRAQDASQSEEQQSEERAAEG